MYHVSFHPHFFLSLQPQQLHRFLVKHSLSLIIIMPARHTRTHNATHQVVTAIPPTPVSGAQGLSSNEAGTLGKPYHS